MFCRSTSGTFRAKRMTHGYISQRRIQSSVTGLGGSLMSGGGKNNQLMDHLTVLQFGQMTLKEYK
jgi:hypothetical protein